MRLLWYIMAFGIKACLRERALWRDFLTSVICAGIFSVFLWYLPEKNGATEKQTIYFALLFWWRLQSWHLLFSEYYHILTGTDAGFQLMRIKRYSNDKDRQSQNLHNAKDIVEAGRIIEL